MDQWKRTIFWRIVLVASFIAAGALPAQATIFYTLSLAEREQSVVRIEMHIPDVAGPLTAQLPAWNALYQIRDFAQYVRDVRATDTAGRPLEIRKLDKQTWTINSGARREDVTVTYLAEWNEPGPFSSHVNSSHAFLNLATMLFYVPTRRAEDVVLRLRDMPAEWRTAMALESGEQPHEYRARNYDALVDAPLEAGTFDDFRFDVNGPAGVARIRVVAHGDAPLEPAAREQLRDTLTKIVAYQTGLMREVPFSEFMFLYHFGSAGGGGGGGMEHANSTAIHGGSPQSVAGVSAHEFFHLWNVKRIRPRTLEPVDYTRENWTRALWFAEGVTSTYTSFTLLRSGIWAAQQFYGDLGNQISALQRRPARLWKSVEEASLDAWLEKYGRYNQPDTSISYYNKGQLLGVLLDILIRHATGNRRSLDDVLRELNTRFARQGQFYDETTDLRAAVERVAGQNFEDFFRRFVSGTEELPFEPTLGLAGLILESAEQAVANLGFIVERRSTGASGFARIAQVVRGSDAERAGLRAGDLLVALNGQPPGNLPRWLQQRQPGEKVKVTFRRAGSAVDQDVEITLGHQQDVVWSVKVDPQAGEKQRRVREGMLTGKTD
jgi:predicted metalloprotease with PDZ domain